MNEKYEGKYILIAEDEETNYLFIREALKELDIRLIWAKNGEEAVEKIKSDVPVILFITDLKMPVMNGYEAISEIHNLNPELPIIAQTAYAMNNEKREFLRMQNVEYLAKPFRRQELLNKIEKMLSIRIEQN